MDRYSRRTFLAASAACVLNRRAWAADGSKPSLCWKLEERGDNALEAISGRADAIASRTGHAIWVGQGINRALRFDGYSVWIEHAGTSINLSGGFTITAWLALEAYPVHSAGIVAFEGSQGSSFDFSIDRLGFLEAGARPEDKICASARPIPRGQWVHLAVTVDSSGATTLYQDGVACGSGADNGTGATAGKSGVSAERLTIGMRRGEALIAGVFETGVLNGLMRQVCIFERSLSAREIHALFEESRPSASPDLQLNRDWCAADQQRPRYHAMPSRAWTNEPHGCIFWGGEYHLFYQKNGNGPYWGNINWGHMTSPDLYRWTEMPAALSPEPGADSEGCWSGSVIDHDGRLVLIYTGSAGHGAGICVAFTDDGVSFTKHKANPVIAPVPEGHGYPEFRDPFIWREGKTFYLIIGSAIKDVGGAALLYRSDDLLNWQYLKPLLAGDKETSGGFWEMPIFVKVGRYHVLIVCEVPGRSSYWVGTWKDEEFLPISKVPQRLDLFNHLLSPTPHIATDGRVILMGIVPDQRSPKKAWVAGWEHLYSLPRVLSVDDAGNVAQTPLETIRKWSTPLYSASRIPITEDMVKSFEDAAGSGVEIEIEFLRGDSHAVSTLLRRSGDGREQTVIAYDWESQMLTLDRRQSSLDPLVRCDLQSAQYTPSQSGKIRFLIFLDHSMVEVFVDGHASFSTRIYPMLDGSNGLAASCQGGNAMIQSLRVTRIEPLAARARSMDVGSISVPVLGP